MSNNKSTCSAVDFQNVLGNFSMKILDTDAKNVMKNMLTECLIWKFIPMGLNNDKHKNAAGRDLIKCVTTFLLE
jgi:hypothetical protein